ncbi:MAG TPA: FHA domain-containing protein, partial [Acidobacteria bacterium]|nr:FHA domain-containing protein [Acidobacteriota bacterium]
VKTGGLAGTRIPVERSPFWIGADAEDAENSLVIADDAHLSGRHACLTFREGSLVIEDRGSTNGTFVQDERLPVATPRPLGPGDRLRVGRTELVVLLP